MGSEKGIGAERELPMGSAPFLDSGSETADLIS